MKGTLGDFFDPTPVEQVIVFVERDTVRDAEGFIKSCEQCNTFDNLCSALIPQSPKFAPNSHG